MTIYPSQTAQIAALQWDKAFTKIPFEYQDYADIFLPELAMELSENTGINKHTIELEDKKQPPYGPIYTLNPLALETLKIYIETHLKTGFIQLFKSPANAPILFDKKPDSNLQLCINYRGLNNLIIKN